MIPSIQTFTRALQTPDMSFSTLPDAVAAILPNGMPRLMRTTRFAEAEIVWRGERWLLLMPLTALVIPRIEYTISILRRLNIDWLPETRILPSEMTWCDYSGNEYKADLVLQHLPAGKRFEDAVADESKEVLLAAFDTFTERTLELAFKHKNLKPSNIRWCSGQFVPLRCYDASIGEYKGNDAEALAELRRMIEQSGNGMEVGDVTETYTPLLRITGHITANHAFEGLVCVVDEEGYGFVDTDNNPIIAPQFLWAGDFREGRAEVETPTGMGLIDRAGNFIIPPEYEIVDYHTHSSVAHVRLGGKWAIFDYLGRRITEFKEMEVAEEV